MPITSLLRSALHHGKEKIKSGLEMVTEKTRDKLIEWQVARLGLPRNATKAQIEEQHALARHLGVERIRRALIGMLGLSADVSDDEMEQALSMWVEKGNNDFRAQVAQNLGLPKGARKKQIDKAIAAFFKH